MDNKPNKFMKRLTDGDRILVAEGYLFEMERRCYVKMGSNVPEVLLDCPGKVKDLHEEFVRSGSDVVQAYTYFATPAKLEDIGRNEDDFEKMNTVALKMAKEVAEKNGCLFAGGISNTNRFIPGDEGRYAEIQSIFEQQVGWAAAAGADYIIGETFQNYEEASLALKTIKQYGLPAVITLTTHDREGQVTFDGVPLIEALVKLEAEGAAVVGFNCCRGPATMVPLLKEARKACKGPMAALPVCFRTTAAMPNMQRLSDNEGRSYPKDIRAFSSSLSDVEKFAQECTNIGIQYVGLCCGNDPNLFRSLAMACGREPPSVRYSPNYVKKTPSEGKDKKYSELFTEKYYQFMHK